MCVWVGSEKRCKLDLDLIHNVVVVVVVAALVVVVVVSVIVPFDGSATAASVLFCFVYDVQTLVEEEWRAYN